MKDIAETAKRHLCPLTPRVHLKNLDPATIDRHLHGSVAYVADMDIPSTSRNVPVMESSLSQCNQILSNEICQLLKDIWDDTSADMKTITDMALSNAPLPDIMNLMDKYIINIAAHNNRINTNKRDKRVKKLHKKLKGNRAKNRASNFANIQKLYTTNPSQVAEHILSDAPLNATETPSMDIFTNHYNNIFAHKDLGWAPRQHSIDKTIDIFYPISLLEIHGELRKLKESAPGIDGINRDQLRGMPRADLCALLNIIWGLKHLPPVLRKNRTALIPKSGNLMDPKQWRPITVSSRILRLLNKIIVSRLEDEVKVSHSQRGFTRTDGIMANSTILQTLIRTMRNAARPFTILSIDLAKAFDRVSVPSIVDALSRRGVDSHTIGYIQDTYRDATTILECHGAKSDPIPINRGVKQGDPMSGFLFNLVLDDLLKKLANREGVNVSGANVVALAFADDIVVAAPSPAVMQSHIRVIETFFARHCFEVNVGKCAAFQFLSVPGTKRLVVQTKSLLRIQGQPIPTVGVSSQLKYLGHKYTYMGVKSPTPANLEEMLSRLSKSPLKPWQKLNILQRYLIPRIHHGMQTMDVTKKKLAYMDRCILKFVKGTLHLPVTTPTAFIHAPLKSGGLGIPSLVLHISSVYCRRLERLAIRGDQETQLIFQSPVVQQIINKLKRMLVPINTLTRNAVHNYWSQQLHKCALGAGLKLMSAGTSAWLYSPPQFWTGKDYIGAVNLRIGLLPTKGAPYMTDTDCRNPSCAGTRESLYHVLQRCPVTHYERINRHDNINKTIRNSITKTGIKCEEAPRLTVNANRYVPDLIAVKGDKAYIIETTVVYETKPASIENAYKIKKDKYDTPEIKQKIKHTYRVSSVQVMPFVVGARGCWPTCNDIIISEFSLPRGLRAVICTLSLQWGVSIHRSFMRTVWRQASRPYDPGIARRGAVGNKYCNRGNMKALNT